MAKWMFWAFAVVTLSTGCFVFLKENHANDPKTALLKLRQEKLEAAKKWFLAESLQYGGVLVQRKQNKVGLWFMGSGARSTSVNVATVWIFRIELK
ncbi:MAG: hypothetical protein SFX18_16105 [Pirellulales bacterium]|nr:hypothetical protein [Pirellulales bacterium]